MKTIKLFVEGGGDSKGNHSFDILALINPEKVLHRLPWAKRFIVLLTEKCEKLGEIIFIKTNRSPQQRLCREKHRKKLGLPSNPTSLIFLVAY